MLAIKFIFLILVVDAYANYDEDFIENLLKKMSHEDKCGQMTQIDIELIKKDLESLPGELIDSKKLKIALNDYKIGSVLGTAFGYAQSAETWQNIIRTIQNFALNETSHGIPVIYGTDSVHGAGFIQEAVIFPQQLSLAATFNIEIATKIGEIVAKEARAAGIPWNFSPVMDIGRTPLWPRIYETFGEDPVLASEIGAAYIRGHQGSDLKDRKKAATCLKHYIGYSYPFNGRDRSVSWIPEILLRETFLPSFARGVAEGALTVMINSGDVNGLPGHANYHYITEILKGELKFNGFTVSDWEDIIRLHTRDKVAETPEEAVKIAVMAGVDMSMVPLDFSFFNHCISLCLKDEKFRERVDDAVRRILTVKKKLGLFEDPFPHHEDLKNIAEEESERLNLETARESVILAKNKDNVLPIKKSSNILVTGPSCEPVRILHGGWSYTWQGNREDLYNKFGRRKLSLLDAIVEKRKANVKYSQGANFTRITNLYETLKLAEESDYIIFCIGEDTYTELPGNIDDMRISEAQETLARVLASTKKPIITVYIGGRPRTITSIVESSAGVILSFLPGSRGSEAIADVIFGDYNPNGRLPISYPRGPNGHMNYDYRPLEDYNYYFGDNIPYLYDALFPFGHGLSYTIFTYSDLTLLQTELVPPTVYGSVLIKNIGDREGKETVLVYLNDEYGSISRPMRQLKYFTKISLKPDEDKLITFKITIEDMSFINTNNERVAEKGVFNVYVSNLKASFELKSTFILNK